MSDNTSETTDGEPMSDYQDLVELPALDGIMVVGVGTRGRAEELGKAESHEGWPVRLRVTDTEEGPLGTSAEAYLSLAEAERVIEALTAAVERARSFPQPTAG